MNELLHVLRQHEQQMSAHRQELSTLHREYSAHSHSLKLIQKDIAQVSHHLYIPLNSFVHNLSKFPVCFKKAFRSVHRDSRNQPNKRVSKSYMIHVWLFGLWCIIVSTIFHKVNVSWSWSYVARFLASTRGQVWMKKLIAFIYKSCNYAIFNFFLI